jgi:N-methylhydantoinase A
MSTTIGVDVGGTFTDLVLRDPATGRSAVAKVPTTPERPELGVLTAVDVALGGGDLSGCRYVMHGTTVGLNALIERRGATVGLLTTRGFRDVLEIRRADRGDPYDLFWRAPEPLVPRRLRREITERMSATGEVVTPLDPDDVLAALEVFEAEGVDAVAVVLLNAWANPEHEVAVEKLLALAGWSEHVSLSHQVSGEYREYERTSTTVVDAFVRRRMGPYLERLSAGLAERNFTGELLITRSGGGSLTLPEVRRRPFETVMSGPVAGATALADLSRRLGLDLVIGADAGGTSFDTVLVEDGVLPVLFEGDVEGLPLQSPWVDVRSVGAGGGSIAHVDAGGLLRVGPRSAGAVPGPACYGRGGTEPTVVDAAVVLGMMRGGEISGGVHISADRARSSLAPLAEQVGLPGAEDVAQGILRIAASHMAEAIRGITVERGIDPRDATVVAFGGAGPLFGCLLAAELEVRRVVVPPNGGNFSAVGLLTSDLTRAAARTLVGALDAEQLVRARRVVAELAETLDPGRAAPGHEVSLDLRYAGQEHTLTRVLPEGATVDAVAADFAEAYERIFGHRLEVPLETVTVRLTTRTPLGSQGRGPLAEPEVAGQQEPWPMWSFTGGRWADARLVGRAELPPEGIEGPALVVEATTTTYVDAGWRAGLDEEGCLVLVRRTAE